MMLHWSRPVLVRVTHVPSGLTCQATERRSVHKCRSAATRALCAMVSHPVPQPLALVRSYDAGSGDDIDAYERAVEQRIREMEVTS